MLHLSTQTCPKNIIVNHLLNGEKRRKSKRLPAQRRKNRSAICNDVIGQNWSRGPCLTPPALMVIRVSSAFIFQTFVEVCYSVFGKRSSFKSLLNLRKACIFQEFAESSNGAIFQKCQRPLSLRVNLPSCVARRPLCHKVNPPSFVARRPLCHKVNLPRCEVRRRHFIVTSFGTRQTNILSLCYLFGKTYKQPTVARLKSLQ